VHASVTVAPAATNMLTCATQAFTATVTGSSNTAVSWSVKPEYAGGVDLDGTYTSPTVTPGQAEVEVVATSHADPSASGSSAVTLATAFPAAAEPIDGTTGTASLGGTGTYTHVVAARGSRVYAAWPDNSDPTSVLLRVARSDDGGASWQPAVTAISARLLLDDPTPADGLECPAITIDASDPDVIYALAHVVGENELGKPLEDGTSGPETQIFAVSTDGGASFTTQVLHVGAGGDVCADVASPAADTVVIASPGWSSCTPKGDDARDIFVWSDARRGKGFAKGSYSDAPVEYFANGYTSALDDLAGEGCSAAHLWPLADGATDASGDATESPRLFTDGTGEVCVTYVGHVKPGHGKEIPNVYVQCSTDAGATFTAPEPVDPTADVDGSSATGALGPDGAIAILFTENGDAPGVLELAMEQVGTGTGFSPLNPVPTYPAPEGTPEPVQNPALAFDENGLLWLAYRTASTGTLAVDKSCDSGVTFSGAVVVDDGSAGLAWPSFATIDATAPRVAAWGADRIVTVALAP
jgi:hypothetical protein